MQIGREAISGPILDTGIINPKFKARNSKQIQNSNDKMTKTSAYRLG
jgi:hypothetical protein